MRKTTLLLTMALCTMGALCAQGPTSVWTLCDSIILTFDSISGPVKSGAHPMIAIEAFSTLSDHQGRLLAYSNGGGVWNANHELMFNSDSLTVNSGPILYGSSLGAGVVFVPIPRHDSLYGLLLLDAVNDTVFPKRSLKLSILDLRLDGGLGGFVDSLKAKVIRDNLTEHVHVLQHSNGVDWWLLSKTNDSDSLRLNIDLLSGSQVTFRRTHTFENLMVGTYGTFSSSPDGCLVALSTWSTGSDADSSILGLFRFDRTNGDLTYLDHLLQSLYTHNSCFSPSSRFLYVTTADPFIITQHDLMFDNLEIVDTVFEPTWGKKANSGMIQRGDDDRLYFSMYKVLPPSVNTILDDYLGSIRNPDSAGSSCDVIPNFLFLQENPPTGGALPVFPNYVRNPQPCFPDTSVGIAAPPPQDLDLPIFLNTVGTLFSVMDADGLIRIIDMAGKPRAQSHGHDQVLDLSDLPDGMYVALQEMEDGLRIQKVLVVH